MTHDTNDFTTFLNGARGITYLMFLKKAETSDVVKLLNEEGIISEDPIYQYINKLERQGLIETVHVLPKPGPPKIREVKTLDPIFDTTSFYRIWKISAEKDERQLTNNERGQLRLLLENIACFLDYFPEYFSWGVKALRKRSVRNMEWHDTLQIFFLFCERLIEVCWEIEYYKLQLNDRYPKRHSIIEDEKINPFIIALEHLFEAPHRYVYDAYKRRTITDEHISALANLSQKGHKDIYLEGTLLQELHLIRIALRDPLSAAHFLRNIEEIEAIFWEDRLRQVNVRALNEAIRNKVMEESHRITRMMIEKMQRVDKVKELAKKIAMYEAAEQFQREARSFEESDVNQALRMIIKIANMDMNEDELRKVLVNFNVCQALQMYLDSFYRNSYIKLKDGKILRLKWERF